MSVPARVIEQREVAARGQGAPTPITSVEELIARAVEAGAPVEVMERLLNLREGLRAEQAAQAFREALAAFQGECPVIRKRRTAEVKKQDGSRAYTYHYAALDHIVAQVRPLLAKHGLSYTFETEFISAPRPAIDVTCIASHVAGHSERSSVLVPIDSDARINVIQQSGSSLTYGKRYAFLNAFGITTGDEDNDGGATTIDDRPRERSGAPATGSPPAQPAAGEDRVRALNAALPAQQRWSAAVLKAELGLGVESAMSKLRALHEKHCEGCTHFEVEG